MLNEATAIQFTTADEASLVTDVAQATPRYIIPNGIRVDEFRNLPDGREFRDRFLDGHSGPVVLFLSRIAKKKGIDILLSAFARAKGAETAMLVLVGPDDEQLVPVLQRQASAEGISPRVRFLGSLYDEDRRSALAAADVWALTSHTENFGNAVLEAMAAGLPIIVSTAVNISPEIRVANAGLVTSLKIEEVASHISTLLNDPDRRLQLGSQATLFAEQYDWSHVAPRLVEMYHSVVDRAR
jgi:glycosyltransferase involved in cell wall biosynthesis